MKSILIQCQTPGEHAWSKVSQAVFVLLLPWVMASAAAQGTLTFTFEGQAPGTMSPFSDTPSGMRFHAAPFGSLYISGGGVSPYPDNGSGHLVLPGNPDPHGGLSFGFTNTLPRVYFSLVSFDAAEYFDSGATNFTVVGYKPMAGTVTNTFSTQVSLWQTFQLDPSFQNLYQVDIYASSLQGTFSLDNVVIGLVPEPASAILTLVGIVCVLSLRQARK
jgi:hypothetical protein